MTTNPRPPRPVVLSRLLAQLIRPATREDASRRVRRKVAARVLRGVPDPAPVRKAPRKATPARAPKRPAPAAPPIDRRYVWAWTRLTSAILDGTVVADPVALDPVTQRQAFLQARSHGAHAVLAESLACGEPLERAVHRTVSELAARSEWSAAWSLAEGVGALPSGATASRVGHAVMRHRRRQFARVWEVLAGLTDAELAEFVPAEAADGALASGSAEARARVLALPAERLSDAALVDLAGRFLVYDERDRAVELLAELRRRPRIDLDERRERSRSLIEYWLARPAKPVPAGALPVAVIDYQTPDQDLASGNLGDYVQTLSLLGTLVRHSNVTFTGEDGLGALASQLQQQVRPDLQVPGVTGRIHLLDVNREFSTAEDIPEGTWMIAFGWHMHPLYDLHYEFPYHRNLRPLFVSFHVNRLDMLTEEALAYLREHGPVGCRDWTTVDLLLSAGVDAFFTGCLTTTVDAVFPTREQAYSGDGVVGVIDVSSNAAGRDAAAAVSYTHQADEYRHMSLVEGVRAAHEVLGGYQAGLARAVTSRLHAYLPLTALGVPVDFRPHSRGDVRFPGLTGLRPGAPDLDTIQRGIRELVSSTLGKALGGASDAEVYAYWRELTAERVAQARARFTAPPEPLRANVDLDAAVASSLAERRRFGPHESVDAANVADVVLCFDENLTAQAPVMLESLVTNAAGPIRLWVLGRGLQPSYQEWLAAAFPMVPITFLPCDHVDYGKVRIPERITISTMDRLLLPHLLADVPRAVYLDIDTLVLGDICRLASMALDGRPIAARDSNVSETSEWREAARRLPEADAVELLRRMALRHGHGRPALNAGVLVLDLQRMREDDFTATYLGWVERYALHDQDVMLAYANADRVVLPPEWNALPVLEDVSNPAVIHWASIGKPWLAPLTFHQDLWRSYADRVHQRAGTPPQL